MSRDDLTSQQRAKLAGLAGPGVPAPASLLLRLAEAVRDRREHVHEPREDIYCANLTAWLGERMAPVLRRLVEAEAEVARLRAELATRPTRDAVLREAAEIADEAVPDEQPHTDWDRGRLSAARDIRSMLGVTPIGTEHASEDVPALRAEVARLRAELSARPSRATVLREAADRMRRAADALPDAGLVHHKQVLHGGALLLDDQADAAERGEGR